MVNRNFLSCLVIGFLVVFVAVLVANPVISYSTIKEFDGQVVRYVPELNANTMIVVKNLETGQNETFNNDDSLWLWKFNSRDYFALDTGVTYHFKVNWVRNGFFSQSRNIIEVTPIGQ